DDDAVRLLGLVQPLAHFLAGLEERHGLLIHRHMRTGTRIASRARRTVLDRERPEAAQLDAVAARERRGDLAEHRVDDVLDVALVEMRVLRGDALHQLRLDHRAGRGLVLVVSLSGIHDAPLYGPRDIARLV